MVERLKIENLKFFGIIIKSFCSMFGIIYLMTSELRQVSILVYIALFAAFYLVYRGRQHDEYPRQVYVITGIFTMLLILGNDFLGIFLAAPKMLILLQILMAIAGWVCIFMELLGCVYEKWVSLDEKVRCCKPEEREHVKRCFLICFVLLEIVYILYFLNQYPGSLSTDTPGQLGEAVGIRSFENANPLINTLIITLCVRAVMWLGGDVNAGVAMYTFVQLTLAAAVFSYTISVIYKKGYHKYLVIIGESFFGLIPYNTVYAAGMWKDTFFALTFLTVIVYFWDVVERTVGGGQAVVLSVLALICSLARNSGWSSLLAFAVFLIIYGLRKDRGILRYALAVTAGVIGSFAVVAFIYPFIIGRNGNGNITTALSVPIQQVSRVVAIGCELEPEDREMINRLMDIDEMAQLYDETISDPIKFSLDRAELSAHWDEYVQLWIRLGKTYPKCYLDAYLALTKNYWYPDASSWTWDARVFENDLGVKRTPIFLPGIDITEYFSRIYTFPKSSVFKNHSTILWFIIICLGYAGIKKNKLAMIMYVPILAIYGGLMFTSPVALFRYTYGAIVCIPMLVCFPYLRTEQEEESSVAKEGERDAC